MKTGTGLFPVHRVGSGTSSVSLLVQGIQYDKIEIKSEDVAPNLYMLSGSENVDPGHPRWCRWPYRSADRTAYSWSMRNMCRSAIRSWRVDSQFK
jgi:hypothetical protein